MSDKLLNRIGLWAAIALLSLQGIVAATYCPSIPFADELENFLPGALDNTLSLRWIFSFQNEHCIAATRLLTWANYRLVGGRPVAQLLVNYAIFLMACGRLRQIGKALRTPWTDVSLCILAANCVFEVHGWAFQTHFYATLLLFLSALWALQRDDARAWLAGPCLLAGCFCFSAGLVFAVAGATLAGVLAFWQPKRWRPYAAAVVAACAGIVGYAAMSPGRAGAEGGLTAPWNAVFWQHLAHQVGYSFAWPLRVIEGGGMALTALTATTVAVLLVHAWRMRSVSQLTVVTCALGILASMCMVAVGRAATGAEGGQASRYAAYGLFLVVLMWFAWALLLRDRPWVLALVALVLLTPYVRKYKYVRSIRHF